MRRPQPFTLKPVIKVISFDDLHQRLSFIALDWIFVFFYSSCRPWFCNCSSCSIIFLLHVFTFSTAFQRTRVDYRFLFLFQCFLFLKIFLDVIKFSFQDFSFTKILKKTPKIWNQKDQVLIEFHWNRIPFSQNGIQRVDFFWLYVLTEGVIAILSILKMKFLKLRSPYLIFVHPQKMFL